MTAITSRDQVVLDLLPPNSEGYRAGKTLSDLEMETGLGYYTLRNVLADLKRAGLVIEAPLKEGRKVRFQRVGGNVMPSIDGFPVETLLKILTNGKPTPNASVSLLYSMPKAIMSLYEVAYMQASKLDAREIIQAKQAIREMLVTDANSLRSKIEKIEEILGHPSLWNDNLDEALFESTDATVNKDIAHELFNQWMNAYDEWLSQQKPFNPVKS